MSGSPVARNYAATLFELAGREDAEEEYGALLLQLIDLYESEPQIRAFLDTPRIPLEDKQSVVRRAFEGRAPELFVRYVLLVMEQRRQRALPSIGRAYQALLDEKLGRFQATITLAFEPDDELKETIVEGVNRVTTRAIQPVFRVDPELLGGMIIQAGDLLLDASLKRQLEKMRWELI